MAGEPERRRGSKVAQVESTNDGEPYFEAPSSPGRAFQGCPVPGLLNV